MSQLAQRFEFIKHLEDFFRNRGFLSLPTPPLVENPGMEVHIRPFQVGDQYLHTSPEFAIKEILSLDASPILNKTYSLSYCFRDEPTSPIHRPQFLMLEWYRRHEKYDAIIEDIANLLEYFANLYPQSFSEKPKLIIKTMNELFEEYLGVSILEYSETQKIKELIGRQFKDQITLPQSNCLWEDYFWLLFLNCIEPKLSDYPFLVIKEFPAQLSALSTIKDSDPRVCERFEFFMNGIEIANCFNELTNINEQKKRFAEQARLKKELYQQTLPEPTKFYRALERGLPASAGIALGVERFMGQIIKIDNIFLD
ncbi:MAG: hypothetical protein H6621_05270 [Halobacteriovoraceae bacterium]|nr:hypothetical protein [Halobacteriovoraceae bacterium]